MPKQCSVEGCSYNVFGKGYCKSHQRLRKDIKKSIKPNNDKRLSEKKIYSTITRPEYFSIESNRICSVCKGEATDIHHMKGKIGLLLNDTRFFLSVCRQCHDKIESNPNWAKENGYSLDRNTDK